MHGCVSQGCIKGIRFDNSRRFLRLTLKGPNRTDLTTFVGFGDEHFLIHSDTMFQKESTL